MKLNEDRGSLVGGLVVTDNDEVIAIKASGQITRSAVAEVPVKGRDTMGVKFVGVGDSDSVVVIALNPETTAEAAELAEPGADGLGTRGRCPRRTPAPSRPRRRSRRMTVSNGSTGQRTRPARLRTARTAQNGQNGERPAAWAGDRDGPERGVRRTAAAGDGGQQCLECRPVPSPDDRQRADAGADRARPRRTRSPARRTPAAGPSIVDRPARPTSAAPQPGRRRRRPERRRRTGQSVGRSAPQPEPDVPVWDPPPPPRPGSPGASVSGSGKKEEPKADVGRPRPHPLPRSPRRVEPERSPVRRRRRRFAQVTPPPPPPGTATRRPYADPGAAAHGPAAAGRLRPCRVRRPRPAPRP